MMFGLYSRLSIIDSAKYTFRVYLLFLDLLLLVSACELDFMARHSPSSPIFLFTTSTVIASFSRCYTGKDILNLNLKPTEVLNSLLASAQGCFL